MNGSKTEDLARDALALALSERAELARRQRRMTADAISRPGATSPPERDASAGGVDTTISGRHLRHAEP